jgi:hypothetical protein
LAAGKKNESAASELAAEHPFGMPKRRTSIPIGFFVWLYRLFPSILEALAIVRPVTIIPWHELRIASPELLPNHDRCLA